jgi:DNA-binding NarL/FixJ family response regulator
MQRLAERAWSSDRAREGAPPLTPRRSQKSTVLIQDRSRLFRESLQLVLSEDDRMSVVDTVATGGDLLAACTDSPVDAVVLESAGVPWDVPQLIGQLAAIDGAIHAVGTYPPALHRHSVDGVVCISRNASGRSVAAAIAGLDADLDEHDRVFGADSGDAARRLTQRELQVLALISSGLTTSQISERLRISVKTVESRRQAMFAKLGVQSQSHAVAVGMRSGLLGHHNGTVTTADPG